MPGAGEKLGGGVRALPAICDDLDRGGLVSDDGWIAHDRVVARPLKRAQATSCSLGVRPKRIIGVWVCDLQLLAEHGLRRSADRAPGEEGDQNGHRCRYDESSHGRTVVP